MVVRMYMTTRKKHRSWIYPLPSQLQAKPTNPGHMKNPSLATKKQPSSPDKIPEKAWMAGNNTVLVQRTFIGLHR